ncbi:MAG: hypothetical protein ACC656_00140 [Candidatus Heimdallarchaeota archaeon]
MDKNVGISKMYDLHDLIRFKVYAQSLHLPRKAVYSRDRQKILSESWWIYSDYDVQSRISNQMRSAKRRLIQDGSLNIPIYGVNRIISQSTFQLLLQGFRKEIEKDDILNFVEDTGSTTIQHISDTLRLKPKRVEKSVSKALKTWNIIKYQNKLHYWKNFLQERNLFPYFQSDGSQLNENTVLNALNRYPFLTINQIALLSGYTKSQVEVQIYDIAHQSHLSKGIMRKDSSEEYFYLNQDIKLFDVNWKDTHPFVLEKRDALVEILKLEQFFAFSDANYWFFLDGIPQAQFNLKREGKSNQYIIRGFNRLLKTDRNLNEIEYHLKLWAKNHNLSVSIDFTDSPYAELTKKMVSSLQKRGYIFQDGGLSLQLDRKTTSSYNPFSMEKLGTWYLDKQMFGSVLSANEILHELIQLDDLKSLFVRMPSETSLIDLSNIIYTTGINYRLGFVHKEILPMIIKGWPRKPKLINLDQRILQFLENDSFSTLQILAKIDQPRMKILARIRYLEQVRCIHRDLSQGVNSQSQTWQLFEPNSDLSFERSLSDIGKVIQQILSVNPPLTINQLSRYMGISFTEVNKIKQELLKSDQVIEGYFFDLYKEIQLSTPLVVSHIQEIMDSYTVKNEIDVSYMQQIHFVPSSDPIAILHLSNLILRDKSLEIKARLDPSSEIWMILWNSSPSGYFLKVPSQLLQIDFDIEIRIISKLVKIPVLSLIIDQLAYLNQLWNYERLYLKMINNISIANRKFEQLQFILDSVGIKF